MSRISRLISLARTWRPVWTADDTALGILDEQSGPFTTEAFRSALCATTAWRDASYAAVLEDGTRAAVPLAARVGVGMSMPLGYGIVAADRLLTNHESTTLIESARKASRLRRLIVRTIGGSGTFGMTSLIWLNEDSDPRSGYRQNARRNLRKAVANGVVVSATSDLSGFLSLYRPAAAKWGAAYPEALLADLLGRGAGRVYEVRAGAGLIGAAFALIAPTHWMYWLGAQNIAGRELHSGYVAVDALIFDAWKAGAECVNLGASAVGEGVASFKARLGASLVPMDEAVACGRVGAVEHRLHAGARSFSNGVRTLCQSGAAR